jgi:hypothetical protein
LKDLSDASFLGKLLVLPANVRLDWKVFTKHKHFSLFGLIISNKEKSFKTLTPSGSIIWIRTLKLKTPSQFFCHSATATGQKNFKVFFHSRLQQHLDSNPLA